MTRDNIYDYLLYNPYAVVAGFFVSLSCMLAIDYNLGGRAEYLNAWNILLHILKNENGTQPSTAIIKFGLIGASLLVLAVNLVIGFVLVCIARFVVVFTDA